MPIGMSELLINHFVKFVGDAVPEGFKNKFYQIKNIEPVDYETGRTDAAEFTAVASGSDSGFKNIPVLEPSKDHFYGFDWGIKDGCRYYMKVPTGRDRLGLDEDMDVGFVNNERSPWLSPNPRFGIWLVDDMYPAFNAVNATPVSITPKIYFRGSKFEIAQTKESRVLQQLQAYEKGMPGQRFKAIILGGVEG